MHRSLMWTIVALTTAILLTPVGSTSPLRMTGASRLFPVQVAAAQSVSECRTKSAGERPSSTTDDIVNCVVDRLSASRVRLTVSYTYASPLGKENILLGADLLAGGSRLKWFGYRPAPINGSSGSASIEMVFGVNSPPAGKLTTDQVEFFMYPAAYPFGCHRIVQESAARAPTLGYGDDQQHYHLLADVACRTS